MPVGIWAGCSHDPGGNSSRKQGWYMYWVEVHVEKEKRTHKEVIPVENVVFIKPAIGKNKKGTCKPKATIFDLRPSCMKQHDLTLDFRSLLLKCTPSEVGLSGIVLKISHPYLKIYFASNQGYLCGCQK